MEQPQAPILVREDALFAVIPSVGLVNLVNGAGPVQISTPFTRATRVSGVGYVGLSTTPAEFEGNLPISGGLTIITMQRAAPGQPYYNATGGQLLTTRTAGNAGWGWGPKGSAVGGGTGNLTRHSMTLQGIANFEGTTAHRIDGAVDTVAATRITAGANPTISWFSSGLKDADTAVTGTPTNGGNLVWSGLGPYTAGSGSFVDLVYGVFAIAGTLTDEELRSITSSKEAFWESMTPPKRPLDSYFFSSAGGGATNLIIQDALHGHTADNLGLTLDTFLAVQEALHSHAADNLTLSTTGSTDLTLQDASHAHTADNLALTLDTFLLLQDALHAHAADNITLSTGAVADLVIQEALHAHTADALVLTLDTFLVIQEAAHAHSADNIAFTLDSLLAVQEATHGHLADNLILSIPGSALSDAEFRQMYDWISELHLVHGLRAGSPLTVTPTTRAAGTVDQTIGEVGTTVTVTRI